MKGLLRPMRWKWRVKAKFFPADADIEALCAGNDMVLLPTDISATMLAIPAALPTAHSTGSDPCQRQNACCVAKYRLGLFKPQFTEPVGLRRDVNTPELYL
ncbi:MAG: hypothetical protein IPJ82_23080 [Lewinellaceae bacterium]|nr:hypothetical protein [Lewinellaceae bacterium]